MTETVEQLWRTHCEEYEGSIMMSKSSFIQAMHAYHNQFAGDGWVDVSEDHLPDDKQEVLFILKNSGDMRKGTYYTFDQWDREQIFVGDGYHNASKVSDWMPLPKKPIR